MRRQSLLDNYFNKMKSPAPPITNQVTDTNRKRPGSDFCTTLTSTKTKRGTEKSCDNVIINLCSDEESDCADCDSALNLIQENSLLNISPHHECMTIKNESTLNISQDEFNLVNCTPQSDGELVESVTIKNENILSTPKKNSNMLDLTPHTNGKLKTFKESTFVTPEGQSSICNLTQSDGESLESITIKHENTFSSPKTNSSMMNLMPQSNAELQTIKKENTSATSEEQSGMCNLTPPLGDEITECNTINNETVVSTPKKKLTPTKRAQGKYFSPTRKRLVTNGSNKRSPSKKKLFQTEETSEEVDSSQDEINEKSLMFLTNIKNVVKDTSLFNLLDEESQNILNECLSVDYLGLHLVCRLYWRLHIWYKLEKLLSITRKHKDIDSSALKSILDSLVEKGILVQISSQDVHITGFEELTKTLSCDELKRVCRELNIKIQSKESAVKSLRKYCQQKSISAYFNGRSVITNQDRVINKMRAKAGSCYKLSDSAKSALNKLYLLMYLGIQYSVIREKKLEWVIIYDKIKKETFPIDKNMVLDNASCVFNSRQEFECYVEAHSMYERFLAETESSGKCKIVETVYQSYQNIDEEDMKRYMAYPEWLYRYTPPYIYIKILDKGVQDLKRQKEPASYLLALEILTTLIKQKTFKQQRLGDWYAEKALILHTHLHRHDEAAMLLIEGFKSDTSELAKETMQPRAIRISRQQNTFTSEDLRTELRLYATKESKLEKDLPSEFIFKPPMDNDGKRGKIKFIVQTDNEKHYMNVEEYCIYHCTKLGDFTHAEHWEGRIIKSIFYLLFWDIIYMKPRGVSGIFLTYYQRYPLDMYYESFYSNRKVLINDKLSKIAEYSEEQLLEDMKNTWLKRPDHELSDIDRKIGWESTSTVAACLGPEKVAVICKRLVTNYGYSCSGFPDVTAWNSKTRKIKFLEVKSDSDKPSIKQIQWMHYLHSNGIDTGFFYVGANPNRNKSRAIQIFEECDDHDDDDL